MSPSGTCTFTSSSYLPPAYFEIEENENGDLWFWGGDGRLQYDEEKCEFACIRGEKDDEGARWRVTLVEEPQSDRFESCDSIDTSDSTPYISCDPLTTEADTTLEIETGKVSDHIHVNTNSEEGIS